MFYIVLGDSCAETLMNLATGNVTPLPFDGDFDKLENQAAIVHVTSGYRMALVISDCVKCHAQYLEWKFAHPIVTPPPIHEAEFSMN